MVIIGLDIGEKRIGIAKTDELQMLSHGIGFFERTSNEAFISKINELIHTYNASTIVMGLPKNLDGSYGIACENIMKLIDAIRPKVNAVIETWDERLTTKEAYCYMKNASLSGRKKKKKIDALAAQIMLQNYLDCHKGT